MPLGVMAMRLAWGKRQDIFPQVPTAKAALAILLPVSTTCLRCSIYFISSSFPLSAYPGYTLLQRRFQNALLCDNPGDIGLGGDIKGWIIDMYSLWSHPHPTNMGEFLRVSFFYLYPTTIGYGEVYS